MLEAYAENGRKGSEQLGDANNKTKKKRARMQAFLFFDKNKSIENKSESAPP